MLRKIGVAHSFCLRYRHEEMFQSVIKSPLTKVANNAEEVEIIAVHDHPLGRSGERNLLHRSAYIVWGGRLCLCG